MKYLAISLLIVSLMGISLLYYKVVFNDASSKNDTFALMSGGSEAEKITKDTEAYRLIGQTVTTKEGAAVQVTYVPQGEMFTPEPGQETYALPKATGKYLEANLKIENMNKIPLKFSMFNVRLDTKEGYVYFPIKQNRDCGSLNETYSERTDEVYQEMNPASVCNVKLLFDIAGNTTGFALTFGSK